MTTGTTGSDTIDGTSGADFIEGLAGSDELNGLDGNDTLDGGGDQDLLIGWLGDDSLSGGDGDDYLHGGDGGDVLDGGAGVDRVSYGLGPLNVTVDLTQQGVPQNTGWGMDTLLNIEHVSGTEGNDNLTGDAAANWLWGAKGDDTLAGGGGSDLLDIGPGAAQVDGGADIDTVSVWGNDAYYAAGVELSLALQGASQASGHGDVTLANIENITGSRHGDTLSGDAGNNLLAGALGDDILSGGAGDDVLLGDGVVSMDGGSGPIGLSGPIVTLDDAAVAWSETAGADVIDTGTGNDTVSGGGGDDRVILGQDVGDAALVTLGAGVDTVELTADFAGTATLTDFQTGAGGDQLDLAAFASAKLSGWNGFDDPFLTGYLRLVQDAADTVLEIDAGGGGGSYVALIRFENTTATAFTADNLPELAGASGTNGDDSYLGGSDADTYRGLAGVDQMGGLEGDDRLLGDDGDDFIRGQGGADTLEGGGDNDYLVGGDGDDRLDGGAGLDRVSYYLEGSPGVTVDLNLQGSAQNTGQGHDVLVSIEHVSGTPGSDTLTGDNLANWLWGFGGDDSIAGNDGDDLLMVGAGDHVLSGEAGADTVALPNPDDVTSSGVKISLALQGATQITGQGVMTLNGIENLSGTVYNDSLTGDANANVLAGNEGADTLAGGDGADLLLGDGAIDTISDAGGSGAIHTYSDLLVDFPNLAAGGDSLSGGLGEDTLNGGSGADTLSGGAGDDSLSGGAGDDVAVFSGDRADYTLAVLGGGELQVTGVGGVDVLSDVESLRFDDGAWGENQAPTGQDRAVAAYMTGAKVLTVSAFGFADSDGDALQAVKITTLPASGALLLDGVAVSAGQSVAAADVAAGKLVFAPAAVGSATFTFQVQDDGLVGWGANIDASANTMTLNVASAPPSGGGGGGGGSVPITSGTSGTASSDVATLSGEPNTFSAGGGDDTVTSGAGNDWLHGNAGVDSISGGGGNDMAYGGQGGDQLDGGDGDDALWGDAGGDTMAGGAGSDTAFGGEGDDRIEDASGVNYLRGGQGADVVAGGSDFDDAHGNEGDDTVSGGQGDDWVVGGKDQDRLTGDDGDDIVYGNLGQDTCEGGVGSDILRGGQDNDVVLGGAGDDWLAGDRGADTLTGGTGADTFHFFAEAGIDRVLDFSIAEGDRVLLAPGTDYSVSQIGADTVVELGGGAQMILVGVQLATLPNGWILGD